ncbi:PREDICTED: uncharacterized protein LOC105579510 isoform X2 [Cercocebus atys]|uniref:uncharacterized protein LOC105579510 isoform X2 n=1 Tax=Cercocebus atys TaxID=9531 RepID=UPI0005F3B08C|nr:PREDICTED: uncharacterized protein LOC105579510 isoform X2 [Cercocebus atys]
MGRGGLASRCLQDCMHPGGSGENPYPCFSALEVAALLGLWPLPATFTSLQPLLPLLLSTGLQRSVLPPFLGNIWMTFFQPAPNVSKNLDCPLEYSGCGILALGCFWDSTPISSRLLQAVRCWPHSPALWLALLLEAEPVGGTLRTTQGLTIISLRPLVPRPMHPPWHCCTSRTDLCSAYPQKCSVRAAGPWLSSKQEGGRVNQ